MLAVPAAALMLGAAEAGSTVGLNIQAWYYDSGASPQTVGYGAGYQTTGFPVTAKAFGVQTSDWTNTDPLDCQSGISMTGFPLGGTLTADISAPNAWQSGIGEQVAGWNPETVAPGNHEVTWGYLDDGNSDGSHPSVTVTGLSTKFPSGYVVATITGGGGSPTFNDVDVSDGVTTSTMTYSTYYVTNPASDGYVSGGTVGISSPSGVFTNNTINIVPQPKTAGKRSTLAGFIITDQPVVVRDPSGSTVASGATISLSAGVVGLPPMTYQWRLNGSPISGATSATYTKSGATSGDSGNYDVVVTNASGSGTSNAATVTVSVPATITWDADTGTTGAQDGTGTWDATTANWWDGSANVAWSDLNFASFGAGGSGSATVTLASDVVTSGMTFNNVNYTLATTTNKAITLTGTPQITTNSNATFSAPLAGSAGFTKTGAGTLSIVNRGSYSGPITVQQGTLAFPVTGDIPGYWYQWLLNTSVINLMPGTSLTCPNNAFGWYGNNNATGVTINIDGATCQPNGAFGIGYNLTGGIIGTGSSRLDLGSSGGFNAFITSLASSTTSVVNPAGGIMFRTDSGQTAYTFTTAAGTTPSGIDLDIPAAVTGGGTVIKAGPGTMRLSASNSYSGGTTVNAGKLIVSGQASGTTTINDGTLVVSGQISGPTTTVHAGTLEVTGRLINTGNIWLKDDTALKVSGSGATPAISTPGSLSVGTDFNNPTGMNTLTFNSLTSTSVAPVTVGDLFLDSPVTVKIGSVFPAVGQYPLIAYTGSNVSINSLVLDPVLPAGISATLVDDTAGPTKSIYLDVTNAVVGSSFWTGSITGAWDTTTANWTEGGPATTYVDGNYATFDDTASNTNITLNTTVSPAEISFENSSTDYTVSGSGSITGFGQFYKIGTGSVTLATDNTYSGAVTITGGTVAVGNGGTAGTLGGSGSISLSNATLAFDRSDAVTLTRTITGGGGTLVKNGSGTLTMSAAGNTCDITVNAGTLTASGGGFSTAFAAGKLITVNAGATLYTPGYHSMGSSVGGGGDVPMVSINGGNWLLNHEQYMHTLTMTAGTTTGVPGNDGIRTLSGSVYTINAAATSSTIGSPLNLVNPVNIVVNDGAAAADLIVSGVVSNSGSITKTGAGRMVLSAVNTYTGVTTVNEGTLAVNGTSIPDTNKLVIGAGKVEVTGTETVNTLFFGAAQQAAGTWGATGSGAAHIDNAHFSGTGVLTVLTSPDFSSWAAANAPGQTVSQDHDNDGVSNGVEYFMGLTGSAFTANPGVVSGKVSWPKGASYIGAYGTDYVVQKSSDLSTWTDVLISDPNLNNGSPLEYTLPTGNPKIFTRLKVTGP